MCRIFVPLLLASTEFRRIPQKHRNSAATGKFRGSAQNSACRGKLWSLSIIYRDLQFGLFCYGCPAQV